MYFVQNECGDRAETQPPILEHEREKWGNNVEPASMPYIYIYLYGVPERVLRAFVNDESQARQTNLQPYSPED